jgi:hypothetical protein
LLAGPAGPRLAPVGEFLRRIPREGPAHPLPEGLD